MTHRAQQIVDAIATLVRTRVEPSGVHVYTHRRESLSAEQDELPAISIDYGEDSPTTGVVSEFRSVLTVEARVKVQASTPEDLHDKLFELRGDIHIAVMANMGDLGLAFVIATLYGSVSAPEISAAGSQLTAELLSTWQVHYSMDLADPN